MSFYNATQISHFDLNSLWEIAQAINNTNPLDTRLFFPYRPLLTYDACIQLNSKGNDWGFFVMSDVRYRFQLWKAPLIQLMAQMQLPPLGWTSNAFVILHLIGDPLDTIWSLSHKVYLTHRRVEKWSHDKDCDAMATIVISHDEWGEGNRMEDTLFQAISVGEPNVQDAPNLSLVEDQQEGIRNACRNAAQSLSADRSTNFIPVAVSVAIFFGAIRIAFDKKFSDTSMINEGITPYYIAHTALYFSILPSILLSAIIGVSQDQDSIPHILRQLRSDTKDEMMLPDGLNFWKRIISGGIYSWQPKKWQCLTSNDGDACWKRRLIAFLSWSSVLSGCLVAIYTAYTAPPTGFGCREIAMTSTLGLWILSASFDIYAECSFKPKRCYTLIFLKDLICSLAILVYHVAMYLGTYNRCSCWTKFGAGPLSFAPEPQVSKELHEKMSNEWRTAMAFLVAWQMLLVSVVCALSHKGVVLLLSQLRNDAAYRNNKKKWFDWQHVFGQFHRARQWWGQKIARPHSYKRRTSEGDDVGLVPYLENRHP